MTHAPKPEPLLPEDFQRALDRWPRCSSGYNGGSEYASEEEYPRMVYPDDIRWDDWWVMKEALRRCAHPTPPSDGAAARSHSPDSLKRGDAAHGDTAGVAAPSEGMMGALIEFCENGINGFPEDLHDSYFNGFNRGNRNAYGCVIAFLKHRDAQRDAVFIEAARLLGEDREKLKAQLSQANHVKCDCHEYDYHQCKVCGGMQYEHIRPVSQAKEGWVLVPKEPTDKMAQAEHDVCPANFETRYKAMIAAAPQASGEA